MPAFCEVLTQELRTATQSSDFLVSILGKSVSEVLEALFMNLVGILQAANTARLYETVFNAALRSWLPLLAEVAQKLSDSSSLMKSLLRLFEEITQWKRIQFAFDCTIFVQA